MKGEHFVVKLKKIVYFNNQCMYNLSDLPIRLPIVIGESEWCLMEEKIITYLTTLILSIIFPITRWVAIEMHSNSPPEFTIATDNR